MNLRASDSGIYKTLLLISYRGTIIPRGLTSNISVEVKADPVILSFPNKFLGCENCTTTFIATVFSRPKPKIILKFEQETIIAKSFTDLPNNTYNYVYSLGPFTPDKDCGKMFLLTVSGVKKEVKQAALIQFVPPKVTVVFLKQYMDKSVFMQWNNVVYGKCKLMYNIEFINKTYDSVQTFDGISNTELFVTNLFNATLVKIYAEINGITGESVLLNMPPAAGILPPKTTNNDGVLLGITFGVVAFIIVACIVILVVVKKTLPSTLAYNKLHSSSLDTVIENQIEISSSSDEIETPSSPSEKIKKLSLSNKLDLPSSSNKMVLSSL
nr:uncharacterized protein LOC105848950 isoform X1 [Hydra vulgaris]